MAYFNLQCLIYLTILYTHKNFFCKHLYTIYTIMGWQYKQNFAFLLTHLFGKGTQNICYKPCNIFKIFFFLYLNLLERQYKQKISPHILTKTDSIFGKLPEQIKIFFAFKTKIENLPHLGYHVTHFIVTCFRDVAIIILSKNAQRARV